MWTLSEEVKYSVADTRAHIDAVSLPESDPQTVWFKGIPRKVNILIWRLARDRLPTRQNLSRRCVEIDQIRCVMCNNSGIESISHVMFDCLCAKDIWRRVRMWVNVSMPNFVNWSDWSSWFDDWRAPLDTKNRLYIIVASLMWHIWRFRNSLLFPPSVKKNLLFDSVCCISFIWYSGRGKKDVNWNS
ncbi:uncharacterized protein [Rutidosis leptorrhynchoides]|uniref:uncharacterized protein n=1 Tax=Rutidosis leptorrhynchoides TaxID=125765 RepID=UPI003A98F554